MEIDNLISTLEQHIKNPEDGLPDDIFYFIGRNTPYVNIDLVVRDSEANILLIWRDDQHYGPGWHLPGGIIRFREQMTKRVEKVANGECGIIPKDITGPLEFFESIDTKQKERSHFITFIFSCRVDVSKTELKFGKDWLIRLEKTGRFFQFFPKEMIPLHWKYKKFFKKAPND
ncbi:NUDIX domain-containing protein [Betaproteobacteria bacterium]|nr:NUDIX domain-containing protein [Betaproteobacteria bacterium]